MKESAALHRLIHSLTKNEKRHFTLFASSNRDSSDYIKIFKAIDEQPSYDERLLKTTMQANEAVHHFAVKKNQLYRLLLRSLRTYHEGRTFDTTLKEMMLNASILSDKALYDDCNTVLLRAKEIAWHYEEWKILLEILHRRFTIINQLRYIKKIEEEVELIIEEEEKVLTQLNNYGLLGKLNIQMSLWLKKPNNENDLRIEEIIAHEIMKSEKNALSFRGKSIYCVIWSSYLIYKNRFADASRFLKKHIELYDRFPHFIDASPGNYLSSMKELLDINFRLKRNKEANQLIERLKQLPDESPLRKIGSRRFRQLIFSWTFRLEVSIAMQENYRKRDIYINEQAEYFSRIEKVMEPKYRIETALVLSAYYFLLKDQKRSIRFLQKIFSDAAVNQFFDLHFQALLIQWLIHYEEGNTDLLMYLFTPLKRMVQKQKSHFKTQGLIIEFMSALMKELSLSQLKLNFSAFEKKFSKLKMSNAEIHLYDYFDITLWLKKGK